ncbi:MAG TPA: hypothetical protein ENJ90_01030, partial [Devosia sp.]|nr:hypothetical protein [Devosia sp.]
KDLFGRADLGEGMTNLVTTISDPLVIAFDGKWGTGKTTFLKMWAGELRKLEIPVIFFDAFENDYADDAFAVLVREIVALTEANKTPAEGSFDEIKESSIKLGSRLLRVTAKVGAKATIKIITAGTVNNSDVKKAIEEVIDEAGEVADDYMRSFLTDISDQKNIVAEFRKTLEALPNQLAPKNGEEKQKPLVFIIDELDRCKPIFALQILERIKHFMSVPNVHFVLGVHMEQLKRSVQFAYGAKIEATTYLQKFINLTIANSDTEWSEHSRRIVKYIRYLSDSLNLPSTEENRLTMEFLQRVALKNVFSLRTLEHIFSNIAISTAFAAERESHPPPLIVGLCILKVEKPGLFLKAKEGQLRYEDIAGFFDFRDWSEDEESDEQTWQRDIWETVLADEVPERLKDYVKGRSGYRRRKDAVRSLANNVVDRFKPNK